MASYIIAKKIYEKTGANCSVEMIGQSGQSLSNPWKITIYTDKNISYELCEEISCEVLDNFGVISNGIINGEFPLC